MFFGRTWRVARIGGIDVRLDSSLLVIAILIGYSEYTGFTGPFDRISSGTALALATLSTVLLFASILLHELAHAGMARARNIPVGGITLYMLGGATTVNVEDRGPGDEFMVTAVGPATSFAVAAVFWLLSRATSRPLDLALHDLAVINFFLAAFNVVPGFPLDGGRLLRAGIWKATGSLERATRIAATVGMVFGAALIVLGLVQVLVTGWVGYLWSAFIGWFLFQTARGSVQQQRLRRLLADAVVREAMRSPPRTIPADTSLIDALHEYLRGHEEEGFPVVDGADHVLGVLTMASAGRVGQDDPLRPVRDAMVSLPDVMTLRPEEPLDRAIQELAGRAALVLTEDGRLVGAIQPSDVNRWLAANR